MIDLIILAAILSSAYLGYRWTRRFVRERLRFVDAVQSRAAPWIAGVLATVAALPLVWVLPAVTAGTAILLGAAVGVGVSRGARDARVGTGYELRPISDTY